MREYLEVLDESAEPVPGVEGGLALGPASAWTAKANKHVQFGFGLNYLIDARPPER